MFKSPAVQTLTFYGGMPANGVANDITNRMERWTGQATGTKRQESRSIVGASIVRNYFQDDVDPNGALTQVNSLALAAMPNLPPGTLPPVVLPFDPTSTTPVCLVALDSSDPANTESILYDVGRYEVRNMIMAIPGANAPVVYGGKIRAVMVYLDRERMQARDLSPLDVMKAMDDYNVFLPTGDAKFGDDRLRHRQQLDVPKSSSDMADIPLSSTQGNAAYLGDVATAGGCQLHPDQRRAGQRPAGGLHPGLPPARRQHAARWSTPSRRRFRGSRTGSPGRGSDLKVVMDQSVYVRQSIESLVAGGHAGGGALLAGDPAVPGRVADDGDRRDDAAALRPRRRARAFSDRQDDQRDDAGRADAGDRPDGRQRHHLPGEHPPASVMGAPPTRRRSSGPARWRCPSWSRASAPSWCSRRWRSRPGWGSSCSGRWPWRWRSA